MKRNAKPPRTKSRGGNLLIVVLAGIAILVLLLRMLVFIAPHGRHRF